MALLQEAARRLAASGQFGSGTGSVHGLFASGGGVPKLPVDEAVVDLRGVVGDVQTTRRHHGRPWQALCLWSKEKVDRLGGRGPSDHAMAQPERTCRSGASTGPTSDRACGCRSVTSLVEVQPATRCPAPRTGQWFADRDCTRMHHETGAGHQPHVRQRPRAGRPSAPATRSPARALAPCQPLASAQVGPTDRFTSSGTRSSAAPRIASTRELGRRRRARPAGTSSSTSSCTCRMSRLSQPAVLERARRGAPAPP